MIDSADMREKRAKRAARVRLNLSLTPVERRQIADLAKEAGLASTVFARRVVLAHGPEMSRALAELQRPGGGA